MDISIILLLLGVAVFIFLLEFVILWAVTKLLKLKEPSFKKALQVGIIFSTIFFLITLLGMTGWNVPDVAKGWVKLQPLIPTTMYSTPNQKFESAFNNRDRTSIQITSASVTESYSGVRCSPVLINGKEISGEGVNVSSGSVFTMSTTCGGAGKKRSDQYLMDIDYQYSSIVDGIATLHEEKGSIEGNAE
jgi:hypothetical protein